METFKSILFSIIGIAFLFFVGFWAFSSIESGSDHVKAEEIKKLEDENEDLKNQIAKLTTENSLLLAKNNNNDDKAGEVQEEEEKEESVKNTVTTNTDTKTLKYQELIDGLQALVNKGVILEKGNQGPSVGLVQKFLNAYNGTSTRIDNDFGKTTEAKVKEYQKDVGLTADGKIGKTTFLKMITWLKSKG